MENKPLPEEAATSNDQVQNTKSPPVPPINGRPRNLSLTMLRQYLSFSNNERLTQPALARSPLFHPPETSTATSKITTQETERYNPNGKPFLSSPAAISTHPNSSAPSAPPIILSNSYEEVEEIELDTEQAAAAVARRVKIPPFFIQHNPDWTDLMVFAPTLQSKLSGRFLRITVQSEEEYRKLATYFRHEQIAFKSFMLKSERPLKLILRELPTSTDLEAVKKDIESEGFKIHKISRLTKFQSKAPMPLIYIQLINDLNADSIYNYVDMFGTRVAFEPYDGSRNRRPNQCWCCQGFFHSSEVCHLSMKCLKWAGPHQAKDCTLHFEDPLKCANCGGEHAANRRQCPRFPKSKKAPNHQNKEQNPDLLLVQETKLQPGLDPLIANYRLHKDDRNNFPRSRIGEGTAIYCKNNYDHNRVPLLTLQYMDAIEIKFNNFPPIGIVSAYARNTPENNRKFPDKDFLKILNSVQNIIIAGDLNAAHRTCSNARSNAFGYALRKIVNNKSEGALGSVANHPLEKAEVIADSLQKQFEPNTEAENDRFTARTQRKIKRFLDAPTCLDLEKTTSGEVQEYIKKLKINKSPGLDLITNRILKNLPLKFVLFIAMLFNLLMENCHFPKNWKTAVVAPYLNLIWMILNLKITVQSRYSVA
ncbi:RNA-directed DNA polymerase from mobile element jockey [Trichonephila clavipes]|nr:RNA-directed DNA polymerase from mobile element jockey [Trichonephila clavipes]